MFKEKLPENMVKSSYSIFHNNIVCINCNLENVELLLDELDFHTKITNSNESKAHPSIPGYVFEHVPTPLASFFVDQSLKCNVPEKNFK